MMALMDPAMETCFGLVIGFPQPPEEWFWCMANPRRPLRSPMTIPIDSW
jgi:hypothetical protein